MIELETRRQELAGLTDENLLQGLSRLNQQDRRLLVEVLLHLNEVDRRRLHVAGGASSLFDYCTRQMGWSESAAGRRIAVARALERFPVIDEQLLSGKLHLSGVAQVAGLLTEENHRELLERIAGQSRRRIEAIVAELRPARRTREGIRALGRPAAAPASGKGGRSEAAATPDDPAPADELTPAPGAWHGVPGGGAARAVAAPDRSDALPAPSREGRLPETEPSPGAPGTTPAGGSGPETPGAPSEARFEVRFSVGEGFLEKLERARQVLSGKLPRGASYEELFATVLGEFLQRRDPLLRARRRELGGRKAHALDDAADVAATVPYTP